MTTTETETVSSVQDSHSGHAYYQVLRGDGSFYLCDADGDEVDLAEWFELKELGTIPADDSDAFFALIAKSSKAKATPTAGFYANAAEVFYVTPSGRVWLVASPDTERLVEIKPEDLPGDVESADELITAIEAIEHCQAIQAESGEKLIEG